MKLKFKLKRKYRLFFMIYLVILTSCLTMFTLSRYVGTTHGSSDSEIAKWEVLVDDNNLNNINIVSGNGSQNYTLRITNNSEVAVSYSISLSNIPSGVKVFIDNGTILEPVDGMIDLLNVGTIYVTDENKIRDHILTFSSDLGTLPVSSIIEVDVKFSQVLN